MPILNYRKYIQVTTLNSALYLGGTAFGLVMLFYINEGYVLSGLLMALYGGFMTLICCGFLAFFSSLVVILCFHLFGMTGYDERADVIANVIFIISAFMIAIFISLTMMSDPFVLVVAFIFTMCVSVTHFFTVQHLFQAPRKRKAKA